MDHIFLNHRPNYIYKFAALIASVLLALFTYLQPGIVLAPGIDSSWAYGLNYAYQHQLTMGKDIYFTFGPLGFLAHTVPLTSSLLAISSNFWFACSIISNFFLLLLCRDAAPTKWHVVLNIGLAILLIVYSSDHIQRLLMIVYVGVFLHWRTRHLFYLLLMSVATVICLMIKFSYGTVALALYIPYLLTMLPPALTTRDLHNKKIYHVLLGLAALPVVYLCLWFYIYHSLAGTLGYIKGGLEFSQGSISAMASNPDNNWLAIAVFFAAFGCGIVILQHSQKPELRSNWLNLPLCFLGPLFIWSKYAFGREDSGHLAYLMSFVFYLGIVWLISIEALVHKLACALMIVLCFFSWKAMHSEMGDHAEFNPHPEFFPPSTFSYRFTREGLLDIIQNTSAQAMAPLLLDKSIRDTIGNRTVDIYPWETLISDINQLNWTPRPIYQSYITYTPFLDQKNLEFYNGANAPEFIVWHYHSYQDIDNRYPFSTDPLTLQAILTHYKLELCKGSFCLWRHSAQNQLLENVSPSTVEAAWNTWIDLPTNTNASIIRAHINTQRTLLGKLNMALWKEGGIEIDYRLKNNDIKTHTLVLDNAPSGIWASPYIADRITTSKTEPVEQGKVKQLLAAKPAEGYIEKAELTSQGIHVAGWGLLPFKNTASQQLRLLLANEAHAYIINTQNRPRPGLTEHFGKTGIVDLDSCGIDEIIDTRDIAPGKYQLHFVVTNEGETRIHTQTPAIIFDIQKINPENLHNVAAIRLRTTRPWAFSSTFTTRWSTLTFSESSPW